MRACLGALRVSFTPRCRYPLSSHCARFQSSESSSQRPHDAVSKPLNTEEVDAFFAEPTWNVDSLLPPKDAPITDEIDSKKLHHLLRLSALPAPTTAAEQQRMLSDLSRQLHFVRQIQAVSVDQVTPMARMQDETAAAREETVYDLDAMRGELEKEVWVGKWNRRVRRGNVLEKDWKGGERASEKQEWDVLGQAGKRVGRFFVVEGGRGGQQEG